MSFYMGVFYVYLPVSVCQYMSHHVPMCMFFIFLYMFLQTCISVLICMLVCLLLCLCICAKISLCHSHIMWLFVSMYYSLCVFVWEYAYMFVYVFILQNSLSVFLWVLHVFLSTHATVFICVSLHKWVCINEYVTVICIYLSMDVSISVYSSFCVYECMCVCSSYLWWSSSNEEAAVIWGPWKGCTPWKERTSH